MGTRKKGAANRVAQRLGFRNDYERRHAAPIEVRRRLEAAGDTAGLKRHDAAIEKNAERRIAAGDAIDRGATYEKVSTNDGTVMRAAVMRAARDDRSLTAVCTVLAKLHRSEAVEPRKTFKLGDLKLWQAAGFRIIDVHLWDKGGYQAELFKADVERLGVRLAFERHVRAVMRRAKYPARLIALLHVDLRADD